MGLSFHGFFPDSVYSNRFTIRKRLGPSVFGNRKQLRVNGCAVFIGGGWRNAGLGASYLLDEQNSEERQEVDDERTLRVATGVV